jgi:pyruvate formate lyase activating enzyme
MRGVIFNLQRYCIHDGPGIRSVAFLAGCRLRCPWCCNPESREADWPDNREVAAEDLAAELAEDAPYFLKSGGGVTLSGGEPLLQPEFCAAVLERCRARGFTTAVETCGDVPAAAFAALDGLVDLYLYDLKHTDPARHRELTGGSLENVLANLRALAGRGQGLVLRLPLVPGMNLDAGHARSVVRLAGECGVARADLMPYHRLAEKKYAALGRGGMPAGDAWADPAAADDLEQFAAALRRGGLDVTIGG